MIKVENVDVWGFEHAIRGMRNPLNSWYKSDSFWGCIIDEKDCINRDFHKNGEITKCDDCSWCEPLCEASSDPNKRRYIIGENDLALMRKLYKAGTEHRKYLRQIFVSMDITAPLYWWKEFDTYKVGTVANSCSTMHTIHKKEFTLNDFSYDQLTDWSSGSQYIVDVGGYYTALGVLEFTVMALNQFRQMYLDTGDKRAWYNMIQLLPSSYNQKRTVTMNYENVVTMIKQRTGHKLYEWGDFITALEELPYIKGDNE